MDRVSEKFNLISFASLAVEICSAQAHTSFTAKDAEGRKEREEEQEEENEDKKKSLNSRALLHSILTPLCFTTAAHLLRSRSKN